MKQHKINNHEIKGNKKSTNCIVSISWTTDKEHILFAGNASYKQQQLLDNTYAGSNIDYAETQETYNTIKKYASKYPTIYLPSHDENSGKRLLNKEIVVIK